MNEQKAKHTPGPWEIVGNMSIKSVSNGARILEKADSGTDADRTLAAAAPELLAALEQAEAALRYAIKKHDPDAAYSDAEVCRAAIRKAKGE